MKKNFLKLGALALGLVVFFAACAQPVEDSAKSKGEDVIIRLFLDRPASETLTVGDKFQIRAGTKFAIPAYLDEETYRVEIPSGSSFNGSRGVLAAGTVLEATRYVWKPRVRNSDAEKTGANRKADIPLLRKQAGNTQNADWQIDYAFQSGLVTGVSTLGPIDVTDNGGTPIPSTPGGSPSIPQTEYIAPDGTGSVDTSKSVILLDSVTGVLSKAASADAWVYVGLTGTATPHTPVYFGADDLSWINDPDVPLLPKVDAIVDILTIQNDASNTEGKAIFISDALANDPNWKWRDPSSGVFTPVTGNANPWFSVLDDFLPQKGTPTNPNNKYYETGAIYLTDGTADNWHTRPGTIGTDADHGGVPIVVTKDQYYVDLVLINKVVDDPLKGATLKKSASVYLELELLATTTGGMDATYFYMYTKDKHGFNTWNAADNKWNTDNANIKTVSLKPGINEVYLRYFSSGNASDETTL